MHVVGSSAALSSGDHPVVSSTVPVRFTVEAMTVKHAVAAAKLRDDGDYRFSQGRKRVGRENVEAGIRGSDGVSSV